MPMAGAPLTARLRIASATSATVRHSSHVSSRVSLLWSRIRRWPSVHTSGRIATAVSTPLGPELPGLEVPRLLLGELVDVDPHRTQLQRRHLVVDLPRNRIHARRER